MIIDVSSTPVMHQDCAPLRLRIFGYTGRPWHVLKAAISTGEVGWCGWLVDFIGWVVESCSLMLSCLKGN